MSLFADTLRAVLVPRRLGPLLVLFLPLLASELAYSSRPLLAAFLLIALLGLFVAIGPWAWRASAGWRGLHPLVGLLPLGAGWAITALVEPGVTWLVGGLNALVVAALFVVGGWGLGRDIELEQAAARATERAEALARQAEAAQLLAIRSHLDPHFLFNTLNAIAEWCALDAERAEAAILRLSRVLRTILTGIREEAWALDQELGLAREVLELHRLRDPDWFDVRSDLADTRVLVPPLLLLPLVENAVTHGPAAGHRGPIAVRVEGSDPVTLSIDSPGPFTGEGPREGGGTGLAMVRDRLDLAYGGRARLAIGAFEGGTRVTLSLPGGDHARPRGG